MDKQIKEILQRLEKMEETLSGQIQVGFASIPIDFNENEMLRGTNNCKGGNCSPNCGPVINTHAGCRPS